MELIMWLFVFGIFIGIGIAAGEYFIKLGENLYEKIKKNNEDEFVKYYPNDRANGDQ